MAVNREAGRWSGKQARRGKAAGDAKARSDRELQQEADALLETYRQALGLA